MYKVTTKILCLLTALAFAVGLLPGLTAAANADQILYMEASYDPSTGVTYTSKTAGATALTSSSTSLSNGWYYVTGNVTVSTRITVTGTVNLILCDGATLTANSGINVASGTTLNIYAQSGGTGTLTASGGSNANAGIGGNNNGAGGTVNIHGGTVTATGGNGNGYAGAGIGGGASRAGGTVTIYGGTVTATGGNGGAGIGGGDGAKGGTVTIYGGTVTATGGASGNYAGAGIGGGNFGDGGTVTIYGGTVTANGGNGAQGIGIGKRRSDGGSLTVGSGLVVYGDNSNSDPTTVITNPQSNRYRYMKVVPTVSYVEMSFDVSTSKLTSEEKAIPITSCTVVSSNTTAWTNGGWYVVNSNVTVSSRINVSGTVNLILCDGATLTANAGINVASGNTLNIYAQSGSTGTLIASGGSNANAGIGGAASKAGGTVNIHGGTVTATGGTFVGYAGAGIGGGDVGAGGTVTIYGGTVTATGGASEGSAGAGIGGGDMGGGGTVTIYGGTVTANGGNNGAHGIGHGNNNGTNGTLTVGSGLTVLGGANAATEEISSPYSTRYRYMKVARFITVSYVEMSFDVSTSKLTSEEKTVKTDTVVAPGTTAWTNGGWYVVSGEVTVSSRITVTGTVNLILCDGATLTASKGINVASGQTLNIYAQEGGTGVLTSTGSGSDYQAGIGGGYSAAGGTVVIHGGTVNATGASVDYGDTGGGGAGIGGGGGSSIINPGGSGGTVIIYGGTVNANGGTGCDGGSQLLSGAGIGGGADYGPGGSITIYGGTVTAVGANGFSGGGAGLGGGDRGSGGTINIYGGTVTATGSNNGAGIGGGDSGAGGIVNIYGGTVTATGGESDGYAGAGIGGGAYGDGGTVTISGGTVTANGGNGAQGIGHGSDNSTNGTLTVGSDLAVYGDNSNSDPTTVITDYATTRYRYMRVVPTVSYVEMSFDVNTLKLTSEEKEIPITSCTVVSSDTTAWTNGWYVVSGEVTVSSRITVTGTVNLILTDGAVLSASKGINVASGNTLNIYAQKGGTGTLTAKGDDSATIAGIGGGAAENGGTVTIYGGNVTANGGNGGAGIGGGGMGNGGTVNIYSGTVTATGGIIAAGIGGGFLGDGSTVNIYGGTVTATGGVSEDHAGAGIGGGDGTGEKGGAGGTVNIYGGTVTANGGNDNAQGIGYGYDGLDSGSLTVKGDVVVFGDSTSNPTTYIPDPNSNRYRCMKAVKGYTVSFNPNGSNVTGTMSPQAAAASSPSLTLASNDFARSSYTFGGWNTSADGTGTAYADKASITLSTSLTLYAQWTPVQYTITYNLDGGTDQGGATTYNVETEVTIPNPTKPGYEFTGWTGDGLDGLTTDLTLSQGTYGNRQYTAHWQIINYTLSYTLNDGTVSPDDNPTVYNVESADLHIRNPLKKGYTFDGWTGTDLTVPSTDLRVRTGSTGNRSYTANWSVIVYELSYDLDGGTVTPANPENFTVNSEDIHLTRPTKAGYDFVGWSFDVEFGVSPSLDVTIPKGSISNRKYTALWELVTYTISYDLQGGEVAGYNPTSYDVTSDEISLINPTRYGYTFEGWTGSADVATSKDVKIPTGSTGNRKYIATWATVKYTISYTLDGGTVTPANRVSYDIETPTFTIKSPDKTGYTFMGWTGSADVASSRDVTIPLGSTGNRTYTANWRLNTYTISYTLNGGTVSPANPTSYEVTTPTFTLKSPDKTGYTFMGWTGDGVDPAHSKDVTVTIGSTGNRSYEAHWSLNTYTITLNLNNGTSGGDNRTTYTYEDNTITLINPTRTGYNFAGWSGDGIDGLSTDLRIPKGSTGNKQYTANWRTIEYLLTYTMNGGTSTPANRESYDIETPTFKLTNPVRLGYTFDGWTGTGVDPTQSKDVTIALGSTGNRSYTANWTVIVYILSYDLQSGEVTPPNPEHYTVDSEDIHLTRPTRLGYDFGGWSFDEGISLDITIPKGSVGNREYTALWGIVTYTIGYDLQGGAVSVENPVSYDVNSALLRITNPTRAGYTFAGWSGTDIIGMSMDVSIPTGSTGNRTYTANWTPNLYTISYTLNNGTASGNPDSYTTETETFTLINPIRNGYQFDGWTGTSLDKKTQTVTIPTGSMGDLSYTANWSLVTYAINYELNGGTNNADNPSSYTVETPTITLKAPSRAGYEFSVWKTDGSAVTEIAKGSTGDKTLTATWGEVIPVMSQTSYTLSAYKGQPASLTLSATGVNISWSMSGNLPGGLSFAGTANSATISGTPEPGTSGTYTVTVTAANEGGKAAANVEIRVANISAASVDVKSGTPKTTTTESGATRTATEKVFKNTSGTLILSSDVAVTTEAETLNASAGRVFTTKVSVDVTLKLADKDYNSYVYSMTITGLPEWLSTTGEVESTDKLSAGESKHHHEFVLTGTPTPESAVHTLNLTAAVKVSGDTPVLEATGTKELKISVGATDVLTSLDVTIADEITFSAGTAASKDVSVSVTGGYADGTTKSLSSGDYALEWSTASTDLAAYGISFSNGTFGVTANTAAGVYRVPVEARAVSGSVTGSTSRTVAVNVRNDAPVLTVSSSNLTVRRGTTITPLKVTAEQGTGIEWSSSGELPAGLAYNVNGNEFVINGTVAADAEARSYSYTVTASNVSGSDSKTIAITVSSADAAAPGTVETTAEEINNMSPEELRETFGNTENIALTSKVENLNQVLETLGTVTTVKNLDLSLAEGLTEVRLNGNNGVETLTLTGNNSVKTVEVSGNTALKVLNLNGSSVATVDARGCSSLEEVNVEGCETLEYLDVSETPITALNVQGCSHLGTLNCASCDIGDLRIDGCNMLERLDCRNNHLPRLDLTVFTHLAELKCRNQHIYDWIRARRFNMLDLLFMRIMNVSSAADIEVISDDVANVKNIKAYDENGLEISVTYNDETGDVTFSKAPAEIRYNYITGFNDVLMDVTVTTSESAVTDDGIYNSHSGCDTGFGFGMMMLLMMCLYGIRRGYLLKGSTGK